MTTMELLYSCGIGIGVVFVGLICIIVLTMVMSAVVRSFAKPEETKPAVSPAQMPRAKQAAPAPVANKQELIAGICAVIAEELGTEVSNIRVTSFKKL